MMVPCSAMWAMVARWRKGSKPAPNGKMNDAEANMEKSVAHSKIDPMDLFDRRVRKLIMRAMAGAMMTTGEIINHGERTASVIGCSSIAVHQVAREIVTMIDEVIRCLLRSGVRSSMLR